MAPMDGCDVRPERESIAQSMMSAPAAAAASWVATPATHRIHGQGGQKLVRSWAYGGWKLMRGQTDPVREGVHRAVYDVNASGSSGQSSDAICDTQGIKMVGGSW